MERIKIGQIGVCHEHADGKMHTLRLRPDLFEVVGVVDDRASTAAKFAGADLAAYEGLPWLAEEELFAVPGLRAVAVETPNLDLVPAARRCLERGVAIHMDKPGGDDLAAFAELRRGYAERGLAFQMGYMFRGNPAMNWIREHRERLGDIFEIQASMSHNYGGAEYQEYIGRFPGGIMFNLGCHLIDYVVALLGRPSGVAAFLKSAPGDPDRIQNHCVAVLEYPHAVATLRACSREVEGSWRRRLKICGTHGSVDLCPLERFDGRPLQMELVTGEGARTLEFEAVRDRYEAQLVDFARMIAGEMADSYDARHDEVVQEVLLAASGYTKK